MPAWKPRTHHIVLAAVLVALLFVGATDQGGLIRAILPGSEDAAERERQDAEDESEEPGEGIRVDEPAPERQCLPRAIMETSRVEGSVPAAPVLETLPTGDRHYLLEGPDARALSIAFTQDVFADCAKHVVVVESSDLGVLAIASRLAAFYGGPLLVNAPGEAEVPSEDISATGQGRAQSGGEISGSEQAGGEVSAAEQAGSSGGDASLGGAASVETPPPPQIHPDVAAEFQRLDPDAAIVIGSMETADELLGFMLASEESGRNVVLIPSSGARSDVASVAGSAASLMTGEAGETEEAGETGEAGETEGAEENRDGGTGGGSDGVGSDLADQSPLYLPRRPGPAVPVRVLEAIASGSPLFPALSLTSAATEGATRIDAVIDPAVADPAEALSELADGAGPQWLVALDQPAVAVLAIPAINAAGGSLLYADPDDLRATPLSTIGVLTGPPHYGTGPYDDTGGESTGGESTGGESTGTEDATGEEAASESQEDRGGPAEGSSSSEASQLPPRPWRLVGPMPEDADWQLAVLSNGQQLPGGGYVLFPSRRIVAMYGHTNTSVLGVLGEQGPAEGVERARRIAEGYDADGLPVITAFEIITTLASSAPGSDNNYSLRTAIADLKPWIDTAEQAGMYVILDLQPGRGDFLTQAKEYEELLLAPHVGLALDPEWRLKPHQFHLRQVGSVDAAEVNQVVDWLAQLVRENNLPQKLLMVHQFSHEMITNRSAIRTTPELAVMIHMDGQGRSDLKFNTYAEITRGALENGWWWGWKNFYDEDFPTLTAEQTLTVRPVPYVVSYQ